MGLGGKRSTPERRVQRGAEWLDKVKPGWYKTIDLDELNLGSSCSCVLGQICITEFEAHPTQVRAISEGQYKVKGDYSQLVSFSASTLRRRQDIEVKKERLSNIDNLKNLVIPNVTARARGFELVASQERKSGGMSKEYDILTDLWKAAIAERLEVAGV